MESIEYDVNVNYQVIQLVKELQTRTESDKEITSLKRAKGLSPVEPETEFYKRNFLSALQQQPGENSRCDFLILITMYDEGLLQLSDTLGGIIDNLEAFFITGVDLNRIACVVIVDGMKAFYKTLEKSNQFFSNFFKEDKVKERFSLEDIRNCKIPNEKDSDEFAHCFMQTITVSDNSNLFLKFIFCVKQKNKRKLNTHLWFFGGFCEHIQPAYVMLLEAGTIPYPNSLFYLYEALATQPDLGGCCGELRPIEPSIWRLVTASQAVEYKLMNIFEKTSESLIGYITYMPGAFSAYRWDAIRGAPLWREYFKSLIFPEKMNAFNSNIYLAMDRILCFAVITKKNSNYLLRYVQAAVAETDVPDDIGKLIVQRRRWINSSWFSTIDSIRKYSRILHSRHSCYRKTIISIQMFYYFFSIMNSWLLVGSFYLFISISIKSAFGLTLLVWNPGNAILQFYTLLLIFIAVMAFGVKPHRVNKCFQFITGIMSIYMISAIFTMAVHMNVSAYPSWVIYGIAGISGCFVAGSCFHMATFTFIKYMFHYIIMYPTYVNTLYIYAICNIHDVTWGSRPDANTADERKRADEFEEFRTRWVILWAISNISYVILVASLSTSSEGFYYLYGILLLITAIISIKFIGSLLYLFHEICKKSLTKVKDLDAILKKRNRLSKDRNQIALKRIKTKKSKKASNNTNIPVSTETEVEKEALKHTTLRKSISGNELIGEKKNKRSIQKNKNKIKKNSVFPINSEESSLRKKNDEIKDFTEDKNYEITTYQHEEEKKSENYNKNHNNEDLISSRILLDLNNLDKNAYQFKSDFNENLYQKQFEKEEMDVVNAIKQDSNLPSFYDFEGELEKSPEKSPTAFVPSRLKEQRFKTGMSLKKLSTLTKISTKRLREIESGKDPLEDELIQILTAFT